MKQATMTDSSNSDFDINILDHALTQPNIELKFPLPTDKETYVQLEGNSKTVGQSFSILHLYYKWFTKIDLDGIYKDNEYKYAINKYNPTFHKKFKDYMDDKLKRSDERLNEIVYDLINQELNMNLINAKDFNSRFGEVKDFMIKFYQQENAKNLPTFHSLQFVQTCYITVISLFKKMFPRGIWCKNLDFSAMYEQYLKDPMSIIFLPNHQSHIDYIIIHLLAVRFQFATPAVIAGENLNVAVFGDFLKKLGAVFIKRSFNNELYTERNLNNVIEFLLLNHVHFEVFIEGTRSRDGKLLLPKYGILKTLSNIFLKQRFTDNNKKFDMVIQPMNITYERIYETDGYLKELIGSDKKQESFISIISNGVSNMFGTDPATIFDKSGFNDNTDEKKKLTGKIFITLGESFKLSKFILDDAGELREPEVNLKKMGFQILHEVNNTRYLPEVAIIGSAIQCYYYYHNNPKTIQIEELLPFIHLVALVLHRESEAHPTNLKIIETVQNCTKEELIAKVTEQIIKFFKLVRVNPKTNVIRVENPIELLYYKNLSLHLIIQRCMVCFILDTFNGCSNLTYSKVNKINYILTGFLKNEFLFDYNYNHRDELSFVLNDLKEQQIIGDTGEHYNVLDAKYVRIFANVVKPFLHSYIALMLSIFEMLEIKATTFSSELKKLKYSSEHPHLIDEDELRYPTTKTLLNHVIKQHKNKVTSVESINKQYLLSDLFYLNNLQLIDIFKNKSKTKAFVRVVNEKDLNILVQFLLQLLKLTHSDVSLMKNDVSINYIVDVIDKNFDREVISKL